MKSVADQTKLGENLQDKMPETKGVSDIKIGGWRKPTVFERPIIEEKTYEFVLTEIQRLEDKAYKDDKTGVSNVLPRCRFIFETLVGKDAEGKDRFVSLPFTCAISLPSVKNKFGKLLLALGLREDEVPSDLNELVGRKARALVGTKTWPDPQDKTKIVEGSQIVDWKFPKV